MKNLKSRIQKPNPNSPNRIPSKSIRKDKPEKPKQRKLGILEGKASYRIPGDFQITEEEFLNS
ncbi:hypothetical protein EHQ27_05510 [Leptospira wolffii]|nr:hypothetical protein EHQ32_08090 [Leptospira wolffii]TGK73862.1 hypothetical protein EHQ35_05675 [Leptospira wolffii]TGK75017.1 hypothetical protein EHQ27_05510 [Leptospira wolffii]TGL28724.1 hypothetical protein EHQ57_12200 [Leptospira wolffii]